MGRPTKLTPEVHRRIVAYIRAGAYDWVGAQAAGIDPSTFRRWMAAGREGHRRYRAFYADVCRGRAESRVAAEVEVRRGDPFRWLRYGPGRERPGQPGWTDQAQVTGPEAGPVQVKIIWGSEEGADPPPGARAGPKTGRKPEGAYPTRARVDFAPCAATSCAAGQEPELATESWPGSRTT